MSTDSMYVGPARFDHEVAHARDLAAEVLSARVTDADADAHKGFIWDDPAGHGADHIIVAVDAAGAVDAVVRLVSRKLRRDDQAFRVAGITSVCVSERRRNLGLSRRVMTAALDQAAVLGYDLAVLFARRAVDHFYPRFDIWGIASYSRLSIGDLALPGGQPGCSIRPMCVADLPSVSEWHLASYVKCFGWFERSPAQWQFLLRGTARRGIEAFVGYVDGTAVGYVVRQGGRIIELGFDPPGRGLNLLRAFHSSAGPIEVDLPPSHPLKSELSGVDVTYSNRHCEFGGHMVAIVNRNRICAALASRVRLRARRLALSARLESRDGVTIVWDGTEVGVQTENDGTRLLGCKTIARLLGASLAGSCDESILDPGIPLSFQALDEF